MKSVRKTIVCLLVLVLPISALASAWVPCAQTSDTDSTAQTAAVDAHAHHAEADNDSESTPVECPCCDGCETACVLSSCSPVVTSTTSGLMAFTGTDTHFPRADVFRGGPAPHAPFRPPIFFL